MPLAPSCPLGSSSSYTHKPLVFLVLYLINFVFSTDNFFQPDQEVVTIPDLGSLSSPLIDTERNLGLLLGLHASYLAMSTPLSPVEVECASKSDFIFVNQIFVPHSGTYREGHCRRGQRPWLLVRVDVWR